MALDFGWKKKAERLRMIVLSGAPLFEIDPLMLRTLETMRRGLRGQASSDEFESTLTDLKAPENEPKPNEPRMVWEPIDLYGWNIAATMYLLDGKPWWLVRATHKKAEPSTKEFNRVELVAEHLGADPRRDRIMNTTFGEPNGYGMWWTWINQSPLYEIHTNDTTKDWRVVLEGTPTAPGYQRIDRNASAMGKR